MKKTKIILITILILLAIPLVSGTIFVNSILDRVIVDENGIGIDEEKIDLMANPELQDKDKDVLNFALFGMDCRTDNYSGCRSDVVMLISYHTKTNKLNVTSVVRDTYVDILSKGLDKLNHAYAYGGPQLAVQTLNRNFDLNIENYITVDFWAVENIIDVIGGVEIDVKSEEVYYVNGGVEEANNVDSNGKVGKMITGPGKQTLTGRQAVAYMRIRYAGNGDFERMERQRHVMEVALNKTKNLKLNQMVSLVDELISMVKTNMDKGVIIDLLTTVVTKGIPVMQQSQLPSVESAEGMTINGVYYYVPRTLLTNVENYHELIYPNSSYEPSSAVKEINSRIEANIQ